MLIKDDVYEGYHFPAGTIFTWNAWHLALDSSEYPDPMRFWPERWLDSRIQAADANKLEDPLAGHWSFGAGRRVCTGFHVGDTNVYDAPPSLLEFDASAHHRIFKRSFPIHHPVFLLLCS